MKNITVKKTLLALAVIIVNVNAYAQNVRALDQTVNTANNGVALSSITMGKDGDNHSGWIQAYGASTPDPLQLNPLGGYVGIGTTTPGALLDVNGTASTGSMAITTNTFQEVLSNSYYGISGISYSGQFRWYTSPNNSLHKDAALYQLRAWDTGSLTENTILTIRGDGNVGIGITSPSAKLEVAGNANFGTATGGYTLSVGGSGGDYGSVGYNQQYGNTTGAYTYKVSDYASFLKFDAGGFKFMTAPIGAVGAAITPSIVMTVLNSGNIGIGTTTPGALLDVNGTVSTGSMATNTNTFQEVLSNSYYGISGISYPGQFRWYASPNNSLHKDAALYQLRAWDAGSLTESTILNIRGDGTVLIGTAAIPAGYKLAVAGNVIAESMTVKLQSAWGDYVFKKDYALMPLSDVKTYIDKNQHLPEIPAAAEIEKDGVNLGEMNRLLVKKVEELTLYLIEKDNRDKDQQYAIKQLQVKNQSLEEKFNKLSAQLNELK